MKQKTGWAAVRLLAASASLALLAACGGEDTPVDDPTPSTCEEISCGSFGHCIMWEGAPACICDKGYVGFRCGECADGYEPAEGGTCVIRCAEGQQDNDGDGECADDCAHANLDCDTGEECSDVSGLAQCVCAAGYQDKDEDGKCLPACAADSCGENALCDDSTGTIQCSCAEGYQDNDLDGTCTANCATADLDCAASDPHSECTDAKGTAVCECVDGYIIHEGTCTDKKELTIWTLMVFLDGDNNLSDYASSDLKEMLALKEKDLVNLIVLYDQDGRKDTKLYKISGGTKTQLDLDASEIVSNGEASMNDWQTLKRFGVWAAKNYPAQHYGLFMWDHGSGWKDGSSAGRCRKLNGFRDFASDDHTSVSDAEGIMVSNGDYGKALAAIVEVTGQKLDIVGFDACLMGMYEVAAASQDYALYLVGSEETEPGPGWPWDKFLSKLSDKPSMSAVDLGKAIVNAYHDEDSDNSTLSLTDLSTMDALHTKLDAFAVQLKSTISSSSGRSAISDIRGSVQSFEYEEHVDLRHFAEKVSASKSSGISSDLKTAASNLVTQLKKTIIISKTNNTTSWLSTVSYENAYGLAIFFPEDFYGNYGRTDLTLYKQAPWTSKSNWDEFINNYLNN